MQWQSTFQLKSDHWMSILGLYSNLHIDVTIYECVIAPWRLWVQITRQNEPYSSHFWTWTEFCLNSNPVSCYQQVTWSRWNHRFSNHWYLRTLRFWEVGKCEQLSGMISLNNLMAQYTTPGHHSKFQVLFTVGLKNRRKTCTVSSLFKC